MESSGADSGWQDNGEEGFPSNGLEIVNNGRFRTSEPPQRCIVSQSFYFPKDTVCSQAVLAGGYNRSYHSLCLVMGLFQLPISVYCCWSLSVCLLIDGRFLVGGLN